MHPMLSLFRNILRLHRQKLPAKKRLLGDSYVKKEFRDHRNAKPEFVKDFFSEWTQYAEYLRAQNDAQFGKELSASTISSFSPEQRAMLEKLKLEASKKA